jgi:hypothetical protein
MLPRPKVSAPRNGNSGPGSTAVKPKIEVLALCGAAFGLIVLDVRIYLMNERLSFFCKNGEMSGISM